MILEAGDAGVSGLAPNQAGLEIGICVAA